MTQSLVKRGRFSEASAGDLRTGVVFSSGFFGFFAHAGFLSALRQRGIRACGYAGTSSGAILAAMAAAGMEDGKIKKILWELDRTDFWDPEPWPRLLVRAGRLFKGYTGYLRGEGFARLLEKLPVRTFEDCDVPLAVAATNLTERREEVFTRGDLIRAVHASGAVPALFKPVEIEGSLYVDGGVVDKAPVKALADLVEPERIIVHYIPSKDLQGPPHGFLKRRFAPWHVHSLAVDIARHEDYSRQVEAVISRGIEVLEVRTSGPYSGPGRLERGPAAYERARAEALEALVL